MNINIGKCDKKVDQFKKKQNHAHTPIICKQKK
jgi:hypothetical protein